MRIPLKILIIHLFFIFFTTYSFAQEDKEFILDNAIYSKKNNWITISAGTGYNSGRKTRESNADASFHLQVSKIICLQTGYHISSDEFFLNRSLQKLNDIHIGVGYRKEKDQTNFAFFTGPAYSYGSNFYEINSKGIKTYKIYRTAGIYTVVQLTYKLFYDIGFGLSLYSSLNTKYQVFGVQLHIYLSGAYKGKI
jgi:hypothetical protein